MKKYTVLVMLFSLFIFQSAFGEAKLKVAVLDATIGNGVETNASAIVADTINEQFVKSGRYIAIDRAYISKIQAEKKFQLSGEVNSADVKELGALFGAQYICVANVSKLGSTYTVSARMIDVTTAQVISQESAKQKGVIDVLFDVAEEVGSKLVGKQYESTEVQTKNTVKKPAKEEKPAATPIKTDKKRKPRPHITIGYMFPGYMGANGDSGYWDSGYNALYEQSTSLYNSGLVNDAWDDSWGIDTEVLTPMGMWYISGGFTYTEQSLSWTDFSYNDYNSTNFYTMEPYVGAGGIFSIVDNLQIYGGITLGYLMLTLGDYWGNFVDEIASGISFGFEAGTDFFLGDFCVSLRYKLSYSGNLAGDVVFTDTDQSNGVDTSFGTSGLILGAGFSF